MKKYKYKIENLDCANCAKKIEDRLNKCSYIENAIVNFSTSKVTFDSDSKIILKDLNDIISQIEPDSKLVEISDETIEKKKEYHLPILLIGIMFGLLAYILSDFKIPRLILFSLAYITLLYKTSIKAFKLLFKSKTIDENALITISCLGAFLLGEHLEGLMVIVLYTIGKILEEKAVNNSRKSISNLVNIKSTSANIIEASGIKEVAVESIKVGDILLIKKGERIPVDSIIIKGETKLDMSALTGESEHVDVKINDKVLSGSINLGDVIEVKASNTYENSTVYKILELLESATEKKAKTETTVTKISRYYTPIVLILSIIIIFLTPMIFDITIKEAIYRGLTFLVISCPCAIAISVPLSYFTGLGVSSKNGILIKGSNYLDNLKFTDAIIFDKTGTLTKGSFSVKNIDILDKKYKKDEIIDILVKGESFSNHPIAKSILKLKDNIPVTKDIKDYKEVPGKGIMFKFKNKEVLIGSSTFCQIQEDNNIHLIINDEHIAKITIDDGIKEDAHKTIEFLHKKNIKSYMFTGDKKEVALEIGKKLNLDEIKYEMLPTDKFTNYENIAQNNKITVFIGDGINDAPVLKRADIGISMGGIGSESAIEASDIVIMNDELSKIPLALDISHYTRKIIHENLLFAIFIKLFILILSIFGLANMWFAVFADTGVTLITILNTLRIISHFKDKTLV